MKYIIPTIDVEALRSLSRLGSFDQLIMGKIGDDFYGVPKILDIIREYDGSGTFYVDFAEHEHGIDKLKKLSKLVLENGNDVQLHIHPQFIADKNRYLMNQYSKEEQSEIFEKCIDIQTKCTGEKPISFRAGGYGADDNTLKLLSNFGITSDSSYLYKHKWCNVSSKPLNKISQFGNLFEIPVTIFQNEISYTLAGQTLKQKTLTKKLDVDGCTKEELRKGFDVLKDSGVRIIVLFLHSFSLFNRTYDYSSISPDLIDIEKFRFILDYALANNYKIASVKEIESSLIDYVDDLESFPTIKTKRNILQSTLTTSKKIIKRKLRGN